MGIARRRPVREENAVKRPAGFFCLLALLLALSACNLPSLTTSGSKSAAQASPTSPPAVVLPTEAPTAVPVAVNPTQAPVEMIIPTPTAIVVLQDLAPTVVASQPVVSAPAAPVPTSGTYTLMPGEFPWCIARRYNLHPMEILWANGLSRGEIYTPGLVLKLPSTGNPFPGVRALRPHPASYIIRWNGQTVRYVACYYGDIDPTVIAAANNVTPDTPLALGTVVVVP